MLKKVSINFNQRQAESIKKETAVDSGKTGEPDAIQRGQVKEVPGSDIGN